MNQILRTSLLCIVILANMSAVSSAYAFFGYHRQQPANATGNAGVVGMNTGFASAFGTSPSTGNTTINGLNPNNRSWIQRFSAPSRAWHQYQQRQQYNQYLQNISVFSGAPPR